MSEPLVVTSVPGSGTIFTLRLLESHPQIPIRIGCDGGNIKDFKKLLPIIENNNLSNHLLNEFSNSQYLLLYGHIHYDWMRQLLSNDFNYKLIIPIRHPLSVWRTIKKRNQIKSIRPLVLYSYLLNILLSIQKEKSHLILPIDLMNKVSGEQRLVEIKYGLTKVLNLDSTQKMIKIIRKWQPVNVNKSLCNSNPNQSIKPLIKKLNKLGIPYGNSPEEPIGTFTFNDFLE